MPQRIWAVAAISLGIVMATLDGAIANVALPSIARDLGASAAATVWVVNGYQLTIAVTVLAVSAAAQIWGLRPTFWFGLLIFTLASLACGFSTTLPLLVIARIVQGLGASGMISIYPALVAHMYPRAILGRGVGISATIVALSAALGPSLSAGILAVASWGWLFLINLPLGVVALAIGARALPRVAPTGRPFDAVAAIASAVAVGLLVIGIDGLGRSGERPLAVLEIAAAFMAGGLLVRRERRQETPLVPFDLMRLPLFSLSVGTAVCAYAAQMLCLVSLPFLLQDHLGWTAVATGLAMTGIPIAVAMVAPLMGPAADRYPAAILCGIGLAVMAAGMAALVALPNDPGAVTLVWREMLVGLGFGIFQTPNNRAILTAGPRSRSGSAGAMLATARLLGLSLGASLVAALFEIGGSGSGTSRALVVGVIVALAGALVSFVRLGATIRAAA